MRVFLFRIRRTLLFRRRIARVVLLFFGICLTHLHQPVLFFDFFLETFWPGSARGFSQQICLLAIIRFFNFFFIRIYLDSRLLSQGDERTSSTGSGSSPVSMHSLLNKTLDFLFKHLHGLKRFGFNLLTKPMNPVVDRLHSREQICTLHTPAYNKTIL